MRRLVETLKGRKATTIIISIFFIVVLAIIAIFFKINRGWRSQISTNMADFEPYIAAYTSGGVSRNATIQVVFAQTPKKYGEPGEKASSNLLKIKPSVKGELKWVNPRTLEFTPKGSFESGKEYRATVAVGKLFDDVPDRAERFTFAIIILKQSVSLFAADYYIEDAPEAKGSIRGELQTADNAPAEQLGRSIAINVDGAKDLKVHVAPTDTPNTYRFESDPLPANSKAASVRWVSQDNTVAGFGESKVALPTSDKFKVLNWYVDDRAAQTIHIIFSQPLNQTQNLAGLIYGEGIIDPRYKIDGNHLSVFPSNELKGSFTLTLEHSIRAANGEQLAHNAECKVNFSGRDPEVSFLKSGYIVPALGRVQIPIRTVGLRAVDVSVYKIYQSNLLYSFQDNNDFDYGNSLQRVGKLLFRKTIPLNENDKGQNAVYTLDLTSLIETEPGAMYRIGLSMRKELAKASTTPLSEVSLTPDNYVQWGYSSDYQTYNYDYNWSERDDPATDSYYQYKGFTWRNVLVSNIGILAKRNRANAIYCYTTNLSEGTPLAGVNVKLYSYQLQELASTTTNGDGFALINYGEGDDPFLLVAEQSNNRSYLNVRDATDRLSFSTFQVEGAESQKGLQGFFYGDRGVWRPGDSIFMTLMVEDRLARLPEQHPVEFTLRSPRGQVVSHEIIQGNSLKMYTFRTATDPDAETGHYSLEARVGGTTFYQGVRIETVKPNRLKVDLSLSDAMLRAGAYASAEIASSWLHGAKASRLGVSVDAIFTPQPIPFKGYEQYVFTDENSRRESLEMNLFTSHLDDQGIARFNVQIPQVKTNSRVKTLLRSKVYEPGGGYTINMGSTIYSPYARYVGMQTPAHSEYYIETDSPQTFKVITLTADGKPQPNVPLKATVYKLKWAWWWEHDNESLDIYLSSRQAEPIGAPIDLITDANGTGEFSVRINYPAYGRYLVRVADDQGGHVCSQVVYWDWPSQYERTASRFGEDAKVLTFECDKPKYEVGERATLRIPSSQGGRLLVSIENGESVLHSVWADAKPDATEVSFAVTEAMAPNAYANVMLIQPYGQSTNDLPLRMYGAIPIMVEHRNSRLEPAVKLPKNVRPDSEFTVEVFEQNGAPMGFTLAVVDEGLLDITNFATPSPWDYFHRKRALGVETYDFYDDVMGGYAGRITGVLNVGGEEEFRTKAPKPLALRFDPVVRFYGPYELKRKEQKKIKVQMPNYVGAVRVMVVAKNEQAQGSTEASLPVKSPLMVQPTLPRVLGVNESIDLPVSVFAMDEKIQDVTVRLETNELLSTSAARKMLTFNGQGDKIISFPVQTGTKTGMAKVKISASAGSEQATAEVAIEVRNPNPRISYMASAIVPKGKSGTLEYSPLGGNAEADGVVEISRFPPINYTHLLDYMNNYAFNALEQQTSRAITQMLYGELVAIDNSARQELAAKVQAFIGVLPRYQTARGGFAPWLGFAREDYWATNYVGHFLLEARSRGYAVPNALLSKWRLFQQQIANAWSSTRSADDPALQQAYRLYTLAKAGAPQLGAMNRLRAVNELPLQAQRRLATAYLAASNAKVGKSLLQSTKANASELSATMNSCYGSEIRNRAMLLEELSEFGELSEALTVLETLSAELASNAWLSSQEVGFGMLGAAAFAKASKANTADIDGTLSIDGVKHAIKGNAPSYSIHFTPKQTQSGKVSFSNKGDGTAFISATTSGIPTTTQTTAASQNLSLSVKYLALNGTEISPYKVPQSTDFKVVVTVTNPGYKGSLEQLALDVPLPSGWELRLASIEGATPGGQSSFYYQDQRDDRVITYFGLEANQTKQFSFDVTASYVGSFALPCVSCRALYDRDVAANSEGKTISVTPQ